MAGICPLILLLGGGAWPPLPRSTPSAIIYNLDFYMHGHWVTYNDVQKLNCL